MNKIHTNTAISRSQKCSMTKESCLYKDCCDHLGVHNPVNELNFLSQISGDRLSGSIVAASELARDQNHLTELIQAKDHSGLRTFVYERSQAAVFQNALGKKRELKDELEILASALDKVKARTKLVDKITAAQARLQSRELTMEYREKYEIMRYLLAQLNEYRVITAQAALASSIFQEQFEKANGSYLEYSKNYIGDLEALGSYETDSPEWHQARAAGIGGSDVGSIMRVDSAWASTNYSQVVNSKLGIEDLNNRIIDREDLRSAIGRGNAWEEFIRYTVAEKHPELNIAFCKTSWHGKEFPNRHANFDGLILDDAGTPEGVLEIKTGSDPSKWGPVESGLAGIPASYRKQTLWYAMCGGFKYGKVIAIIDDHDYREYSFSMSDPLIQAEINEMIVATDEFWVYIQARKSKSEAGELITRKRQKRGMKMTHDYDNIAEVFAGYAGISRASARKQIVDTIETEKAAKGRLLTEDEFQSSAVAVFATHDPSKRNRPLIGVDLETSTTSPRTGRIIETGIARLDQNGSTDVVYSSMHDIPEYAKAGVGLGQFSIHHITAEMISGTVPFDNPEEQKRILSYLKSGTFVAHNAGFEDRWFEANLPGYVEAKNNDEIQILDTRRLSSFLMPQSDDSSLQSFAEDNGIPYEGAHAATADAVMMMKALSRLQLSIFQTGIFKSKSITEASRREARQIALESNKDR